jgi:hypothetical protein
MPSKAVASKSVEERRPWTRRGVPFKAWSGKVATGFSEKIKCPENFELRSIRHKAIVL